MRVTVVTQVPFALQLWLPAPLKAHPAAARASSAVGSCTTDAIPPIVSRLATPHCVPPTQATLVSAPVASSTWRYFAASSRLHANVKPPQAPIPACRAHCPPSRGPFPPVSGPSTKTLPRTSSLRPTQAMRVASQSPPHSKWTRCLGLAHSTQSPLKLAGSSSGSLFPPKWRVPAEHSLCLASVALPRRRP